MKMPFRKHKFQPKMLAAALAAILVSALWGCSGTNNSNNGITCGPNGVCYNAQGVPVNGGGAGPGGIILQSNGTLMITNQIAWNTFLRGSQACMTAINSCYGMNGAPGITININDPTFSGGFSQGNMTIEAQAVQIPYAGLYFRQTGSGFAAGIQTNPYIQINPGNTNSGALYYVYVTGSPTASNQQVAITTNGQTIATGTLVRIQ